MTNQERITTIYDLLNEAFHPNHLEVIDESHLHVGHVGAKSGMGHFKLRIAADEFNQKNDIAIHRMIFAALGDLMKTDIHALSIELV